MIVLNMLHDFFHILAVIIAYSCLLLVLHNFFLTFLSGKQLSFLLFHLTVK